MVLGVNQWPVPRRSSAGPLSFENGSPAVRVTILCGDLTYFR